MNSRWGTLVSASLVGFAFLVIAWQFLPWNAQYDFLSSIVLSCIRGGQLAAISDITERDRQIILASGANRNLDLVLPKDARVFMTDMTGPTNYDKIGYYFYKTYYLFPREIGVSVDQPTRMTKDGFLGRTAESDQEILTNGYDVRMDIVSFPRKGGQGAENLRKKNRHVHEYEEDLR